MEAVLNYRQERATAIANSIIATAKALTEQAKELPVTKKKFRGKVKINRRPNVKRKRAMVIARMALTAYIGATQTSIIISQPIPKYKKSAI